MVSIQPAQTTDGDAPYDPMLASPYPYHIEPDGKVARQDFWRGSPAQLLGFQRGSENTLVLTVKEFEADPEKCIGLCPVFIDEGDPLDPQMWAGLHPITKVTRS